MPVRRIRCVIVCLGLSSSRSSSSICDNAHTSRRVMACLYTTRRSSFIAGSASQADMVMISFHNAKAPGLASSAVWPRGYCLSDAEDILIVINWIVVPQNPNRIPQRLLRRWIRSIFFYKKCIFCFFYAFIGAFRLRNPCLTGFVSFGFIVRSTLCLKNSCFKIFLFSSAFVPMNLSMFIPFS